MIKNLKSDWGQVILGGLGIVVLYFLLRLVNLTILPIFCDEAIYIRWSQVMRAEPTLRFLPLSDGKQPLFMWLTIPFLKIIADPLFAGRLVSILAGLGTLGGVFLLSLVLFGSKRIALFSSLLYAVVPYAVFFDRLALVDSLLTAFGVWVLLLGVLLVKYFRTDLAIITGIILGSALLTKSPATFFALLLPTTVILLSFKSKKKAVQLIKLVGLWLIVYFFAYALYNIQRLGPNFNMIAIRNRDYVFSFQEILSHPLDPLKPHLFEIWDWFGTLLTWPIFLAALVGLVWGLLRKEKSVFLLFLWSIVPLLFQAGFAKVFTARYLLFTIPLFLILVAFFLKIIFEKIKLRGVFLAILSLFLIWPLWFDWLILTNPEKAPLPKRERSGYLEEWTAGTGIKEASLYLRDRAKQKQILVGTEGFFGTLPDGLQVYLEKVPNTTIIGIGLYPNQVPEQLISSLADNEVYLLINDERLALNPQEYNLSLVARWAKAKRANGTYQSLLLLKLEPEQ